MIQLSNIKNPEVLKYIETCIAIWKENGVTEKDARYEVFLKAAIERGRELYPEK